MLKAVFLLAGLVLAFAALAPDLVQRLALLGEAEPGLQTVEPAPNVADHGGLVRLSADRNGHYFTDIEVNDRTLKALVDTGATVIALRYEDARALGLVRPGDKFDLRVRTANGEGRAKRVELRSVSVGTITLRRVDAMVAEQGALATNLLGMSFLKRLARFEVRRGQLVLEH